MTIKTTYVNIEQQQVQMPKLVFCGYTDNHTAPSLSEIYSYRNLSDEDRGCSYFWNDFKYCVKAMVIDKYLDTYVLERMYNEIDNRVNAIENFSIKILYSRNENNKKQLIELIKETAKQKNGNLEFKCIPEEKWIIHDRFAYIDGVLWHFGAYIGGGHKNFNAYSTGWINTEFNKLFDNLWKQGF